MLGIGEFAGMTGLSVKALRHYDEKGVLVPTEVDPRSGYRRYREDQVRAGVLVRTLRTAGVPLPAVAAAIATGTGADALAAHRAKVLAEREHQDRAFTDAGIVLRALAVPVEVREQRCPEQPYVERVIRVPVDEADQVGDDDANALFAALHAEVNAAGAGPNGPFWTTLRAGDDGHVEIACCWPTTVVMDPGPQTRAGVLPARTELVATWPAGPQDDLPSGTAHPAVVALFDAVARRGKDMPATEVRQRVLGADEDNYTVEVAITLGG